MPAGEYVLVIYDGGDNTYLDPARPGREGSKTVLNAFCLQKARLYDFNHLASFCESWLDRCRVGEPCDWDATEDRKVDFDDFVIFARRWLGSGP